MASLMEAFGVKVPVRADTDDFDRDLERKLRKVDGNRIGGSVGKSIGNGMRVGVAGPLRNMAGLMATAFAAVKVGGFLKGAISDASNLGETMSKSAAVFGPANKAILEFGRSSAVSIGQSKQEATAAAAQFGNMFNQLGIGQKPAADMSIQMVKLASDFASFHNADISEVLEAQEAAFRGEYDSVQRFVPTINAAAVEQEGLRLKLAGSSKELTAQDKALATQSLLMSGAGKATGDFARTSDGLANQQRILSARFADFKTTVGAVALPLVTQFFGFLNDKGIPAIQAVSARVTEFVQSEGFTSFLTRVRSAAGTAFEYFKTNVLPRLQEFAGYLRDTVIPIVVSIINDHFKKLQGVFNDVRDAVSENKPQLTQLWNGLQAVAKVVIEKVIPFLYTVGSVTLPALGKAISSVITVTAGIVTAFNAIKEPIRAAIQFVWEKVSGVFENILTGSAKAFGWVPGLGGKLETAAEDFTAFRDDVNRSLDGIDDEAINVAMKYSAKGVNLSAPSSVGRGMWRGGPLHGPGTGTSDDIPIMGSDGEHMWTAREVLAAGGHRAVEALRALALKGGLRGFRNGGALTLNTSIPAEGPIEAVASGVAKQFGQVLGKAMQAVGAGPSGPPGAVQSFRGERLNARTIRMLLSAEAMLGRAFNIMQGSYSTRVAASGGTHSGGGAMDTDNAGVGWPRATSALRRAGFASWTRDPSQGPWGWHQHSIAIGDPSASPSAKRQVQSFLRGGNGLGGMWRGGPVSYAKGTPWVPSDQLALLHRGEAVVPAHANRGAVSVQFSNCTFAGTSQKQFEDLVVGAVDKARGKRRI
jgi:hypothetical protein